MEITRGGFLKLAAAVGGAGLSAMGLGAATTAPAGTAAAGTPGGRAGAMGAGAAGGGDAGNGPEGAKAGTAAAAPSGTLDSQRFRAAVAAGDATLVSAYLRQDPALAGSRDERGRSVLEIACLAGRSEVAELLLGIVHAALLADARADLLHDLFDVDRIGANVEVGHKVRRACK